jgi:sensor c-di-GMP phosphodiesterase-like protein
MKEKLQYIDNNMVYYIQKPNIDLIAIEPLSSAYKQFYATIFLFLPFGIVTSLFIIFLVIYYSMKQLSFDGELKRAVKNREFIVYYQPIMEPSTKKCIGAEALVRWRQSNGELVRPDLFIPLAEKNGHIPKITNQVIDCVISDLSELLLNNPSLHISINIHSDDIQSGRILKVLERKLANTGILRNQIWIEITERVFLEFSLASKHIDEARALGYVVVVDDFGTGYSSLSLLQNIKLDILKIDKSFIDTITTNSVTSDVTSHIISIANELKLNIVAEGVESIKQLDYLQKRGVNYIQGYYFSKPISADAFKAFYASFNVNVK